MKRTDKILERNLHIEAPVLNHYLNEIIRIYNPIEVYIIGSVATGNSRQNSDIDFVVRSEGFIDTEAITGAIDIIPYHQLNEAMLNHLKQQGVLVYEREKG